MNALNVTAVLPAPSARGQGSHGVSNLKTSVTVPAATRWATFSRAARVCVRESQGPSGRALRGRPHAGEPAPRGASTKMYVSNAGGFLLFFTVYLDFLHSLEFVSGVLSKEILSESLSRFLPNYFPTGCFQENLNEAAPCVLPRVYDNPALPRCVFTIICASKTFQPTLTDILLVY